MPDLKVATLYKNLKYCTHISKVEKESDSFEAYEQSDVKDYNHENIEEKVREKFQKAIEPFVKGTLKEKTLSREEMEQLLVRKLLELTNPNSEYDILLFQKVAKICKTLVVDNSNLGNLNRLSF